MPRMNIFDAKLVKNGDKYAVAIGGIEVEVSADKQARLAANNVEPQDITLGVRPEHLTLEGSELLKGTVDVYEMMGSEIHLHVAAAGKDVVVRVPTVDLSSDKRGGFAYGSDFNFTFRADQIHLFDPASERNLLPLAKK